MDELAWTGVSAGGITVNNLRYADDIVLISSLQQLVSKKVLSTSSQVPEALSIMCHNVCLEQVDRFKYLGVWITSEGGCGDEIYARLGVARSVIKELQPIWKDRAVSKQTKLRSLSWSVATYGCEMFHTANYTFSRAF